MNELLRSCKELREASAACFRVIFKYAEFGAVDDIEAELERIGLKNGWGVRAQEAIAKAEGGKP